MTCADIPLLLFAKAPIAGKVKTRLTSHCSEQQAADIAELLIEASIQNTTRAWKGPVFLSVWLDHEHPFFEKMLARYSISMTRQCAGDLGEKMRHGLNAFGYPAAVMGCDVPQLGDTGLQEAYDCLSAGEPVIGPADDGGYYLLGLTQDSDHLFENMPWGQSSVLAKTLQSANEHQLSLHKLDALNDVDEWGDLLDAAELVPSLKEYLLVQRVL